jgi:hypothetical protein
MRAAAFSAFFTPLNQARERNVYSAISPNL